MYSKETLKHFTNPKNAGEIKDADCVGKAGNEDGDKMVLYLKIKNNIIKDAKFKTFGCAAAIASSSATTEMIKGKTIDDALKITREDIVNFIGGLPENKIECSVIGQDALKNAIENYKKKNS